LLKANAQGIFEQANHGGREEWMGERVTGWMGERVTGWMGERVTGWMG
jgi:hypothetical protein